jgi:hypothetical protein
LTQENKPSPPPTEQTEPRPTANAEKVATPEQQRAAHFEAAFQLATATAPADRPRAERAAKALAQRAGVKVHCTQWVADPTAGPAAVQAAWKRFRDGLWKRLKNALGEDLRPGIRVAFLTWLKNGLGVDLPSFFQFTVQNHIRQQTVGDLERLLRAIPVSSPVFAAGIPLRRRLQDELPAGSAARVPVADDGLIWHSLRDTARLAACRYEAFPEIFRAELAQLFRDLEWLQELQESCFAAWLVPGTLILCERPTTVELADGMVKEMTWTPDTTAA